MKQIIVEGPDGAGKSTLIQSLSQDLGLPVHPRSSSSTGGPVDNLTQWVKEDLRTWNDLTVSLYDRHPMVSEYIYGPVMREELKIDLSFAHHRFFANNAIVILCLPPASNVVANVSDDLNQLSGVADRIWTIYALYEAYAQMNQDRVLIYDYTIPGSYWDLHRILLGMTRN